MVGFNLGLNLLFGSINLGLDLLLGSINLGGNSLVYLVLIGSDNFDLSFDGFNLGGDSFCDLSFDNLDLILNLSVDSFNFSFDGFNLGGDNLHVDVDPLDFLLNLAGENLDLGNFSVELAYLRSNMLFD